MMSIHDRDGGRKYLTGAEHARFLLAADQAPRDVRAFCHTLAWTGCRVSEALALTGAQVDVAGGTITFETLKKRQRGLFRTVPIPPTLPPCLTWCSAFVACAVSRPRCRCGRSRGQRLGAA